MPRPSGREPSSPDVKVSCAQHIQTRDGTLTKDAKMVNCFVDKSESTGTITKKRAGTGLIQANPAAKGQGQFYVNAQSFAISGDIIYKTGSASTYTIPSVTTAGQQYQCLSDVPLGTALLKSASGLWTFNGTTVTKVTDANYPTTTAYGITELDGTYYVLDTTGVIHGSAIQDPTTWPALNFIGIDSMLGGSAGLVRHLNYLSLFTSEGLQLFYDAGNSPGIPLSPVSNASFRTGCAVGDSLVELDDVTLWVAQTTESGRSIALMAGLSLETVSNPYIDLVLNLDNLSEVHACGIKASGHTFYVLTLVNTNVTLVYDLIFKEWYLWSSVVGGVEQYFVGINYLRNGGQDLLQDAINGNVLSVLPSQYSDESGPINFFVRTVNYNWGSLNRKFLPTSFLLGDTLATLVSVRYSDDDYQTFSAYRTIDMSSKRKMLQRCGSSRERSWDFFHNDNTPLRLAFMKLEAKASSE